MKQQLERIRDLIQPDINNRGLRADPERNLINACADDFITACRHLAETANPVVGVVTGFLIPHATPPAGETDGPLGALFLARALIPLGFKVVLLTDAFAENALRLGLIACGFAGAVQLHILQPADQPERILSSFPLTHLIALERAGPSHTPESVRQQGGDDNLIRQFLNEVPPEHRDRCHTMKGRDITDRMTAAHHLIEAAARITTIGIGDGGNEIGMGKIPWDVIRRNIPNGGLIACRVPTDYLFVCGVSNWGAYGLAAGMYLLRGQTPAPDLFDPERERALLQIMVERGPLVDGVSGQPTVSVDGLSFERYIEPLIAMRELLRR